MSSDTEENNNGEGSASGSGIVPALRILCLHDNESNANELSNKLELLGERLYEKHAIDLVYINSPLVQLRSRGGGQQPEPPLETVSEEHEQQQQGKKQMNKTKDNRKRIWWDEYHEQLPSSKQKEDDGNTDDDEEKDEVDNNHTNATNDATSSSSSDHNVKKHYDGLDCSLLLLRQVWQSMPFWGIIAVGSGAAVGSFLPLMPDLSSPGFCIFVNGETILNDEDNDETKDQRLIDHLPCLHIQAPNPGPSSRRLYKQFGGTIHPGGSNFTKSTINRIGKFIIDQKKSLRMLSVETKKVLALQNMLYLKEQECATAVAQHIASNPPKVLTAVISPQSVGGFSGGKKRNPVGTGGAPCPSEFLLKKDKRQQPPTKNGPSRQHPSQQRQPSSEEKKQPQPPNDEANEE